MNFRKFRKNAKALSPVIATIILIAVTVAVSVVVAAWMGALTIGFMGNAESASITNTQYISSTVVDVTVQNSGASTVTISSAFIDGNPVASISATGQSPYTGNIAKGTSVTFVLTLPAGGLTAFVNTAQYTVKLMTAKGNSVVSTSTYSSP